VLHALAAVRAGKDIYVEKPLGLSLQELKTLREAVHRYERVFQFGTQQRSDRNFRFGLRARAQREAREGPHDPCLGSLRPQRADGIAHLRAHASSSGFRLRVLAGAGPVGALHSQARDQPALVSHQRLLPGIRGRLGASITSTLPSGGTARSSPGPCRWKARASSRRMTGSATTPRPGTWT